jgi:ketosteroid isomerase-like protein
MLKAFAVWILLAATGGLYGQSGGKEPEAPPFRNNTDETAIRSLLAFGFETSWNNHRPADALTPDKCMDEAVFINTTGGWVMGRENFRELITRLHAPGGPFHDHTRRHAIEELRLIRPDVAFAVVKTFDIKRAGVPTKGEETRGLIILRKEEGRWKVNALENTKIQPMPTGHP